MLNLFALVSEFSEAAKGGMEINGGKVQLVSYVSGENSEPVEINFSSYYELDMDKLKNHVADKSKLVHLGTKAILCLSGDSCFEDDVWNDYNSFIITDGNWKELEDSSNNDEWCSSLSERDKYIPFGIKGCKLSYIGHAIYDGFKYALSQEDRNEIEK